MSISPRKAALAAGVAFLGGVGLSNAVGPALHALTGNPAFAQAQPQQRGGTDSRAETYRLLNLFGDVFEFVRAEYVEPVNDRDLIENAINGMLTALDPHSGYMNQRAFRDMQVQTRGEFGGLGIEVTQENGLIRVIAPIDDTPAARAGVRPGDLITHINGQPVVGLSLNEAVERMRGPPRTEIKVTIRRGTQAPFDMAIIRDVIRVQSVRWRMEGDVAYIRITSFTEQTDAGLRRAVAQAKERTGNRLQGYVIDLRNNPGGLLEQAVAVSDDFLNQGEIVSTRARRAEESQRYNARPGDIADGLPIAVIINEGSASASEIVAGALQDHRRAVVLGTRSFGKGSVQTVRPLPGNGAMRITTARYYTPSGRSIQQVGIDPDIVVQAARIEPLDAAARPRTRESDLRGSLRNEQQPGAPAPAQPEPAQQQPQQQQPAPGTAPEQGTPPQAGTPAGADPAQDYQLQRALDLVRGLALMRRAN
ncbi:MAG: S41 family peptidase [Alphaproteobacteria bacterium]|nr:S41 family peptidase [Alphaproteobacteria bacterium]